MASTFEQKSIQYYSSSLDKLDELIENAEEQKEEIFSFFGDVKDKLNYLSKDSEFQKSIKNTSTLLNSVIKNGKLNVDLISPVSENNSEYYEQIIDKLDYLGKGLQPVDISSNNNKIEELITLSKEMNNESISFFNSTKDKLDYLTKGSDFQNSIKNTEKLLTSVIKNGKLNVDISTIEFGSEKSDNNIDSKGKNYNNTYNIVGGTQIMYPENLDSKGLLDFTKGLPTASKNLQKAISIFDSIDSKSIENFNILISEIGDSFSKLPNKEDSVASVASIEFISNNINRIGKLIQKADEKFEKSDKLGENFTKFLGVIGNAFDQFPDADKTESVSTAIDILGFSITKLGTNLIIAEKLYKNSDRFSTKFLSVMTNINKAFRELDTDDIKDKIEDVSKIKSGILGLGFGLLIAAPLYAIGSAITVPLLTFTLGAIGLAFRLFPSAKKTREVSKSLFITSIGITTLGLSLLAWDMMDFDAETVVGAVLTIGTLGATFALLGKFSKGINQGSVAVGIMALSLGLMTASLSYAMSQLGSDPMGTIITVGILGLSIAGLGIVYYGIGQFMGSIVKGAVGVTLMAGSIALFGMGISYALEQLGGNPIDQLKSVGVMALSLVGLGATYALLGSFVGLVLAGSVAVAAIGLSTMLLGSAMGDIMSIDWDWETLGQFGATLTGLGLIYAGAGAISPAILLGAAAFGAIGGSLILLEEGMRGFLGLQSEDLSFFTNTTDGKSGFAKLMVQLSDGSADAASFTATAGAGTMAAIGLSLQALSKGIEPFIGDDNAFVKALDNDLGGTLSKFIEELTDPFIALNAGNSNDSLIGDIFGADFGLPDAMNGARSVSAMGDALQSIVKGIEPFAGSNNEFTRLLGEKVKVNGKSVSKLGNDIGSFISQLSQPFIDVIGDEGASNDSWFATAFGADLSISKAKEGAHAVQSMGDALLAIATGIKPFGGENNEITKILGKKIEVNGKTVNSLGYNIGSFIEQLTGPFQSVAEGSSNDSWLSSVFGNDFSISKAKEGAHGVQSMGDALQSIAKGIKPFGGENNEITKILGKKIEVNGKTVNSLGYNIGNFIEQLTGPFQSVAEGPSNGSWLSSVFGSDFSISKAKEGAQGVQSMGDALQSIAKGIKPFTGTDNEIVKAIDNNIGETIAKFIITITDPFIAVVDGENGNSNDSMLSRLIGSDFSISKALEGADTVKSASDALASVGESAFSFSRIADKIELDKYKKQVNTLVTALPNAYTDIILPEDVKGGEDKMDFFESTFEKVSNATKNTSKLKKAADQFDRIADAFESMSNSTANMKTSISSLDVEKVKGFNDLLSTAKEFVKEADQGSIDSAIDSLSDKIGGVLSSISGSSDSNNETTTSTTTISQSGDKAITRKELLEMFNELANRLDSSSNAQIQALRQVKSVLAGTLNVRDVS